MLLRRAVESLKNQPAAYVVAPLDNSYLYKGACRDLTARMSDHCKGCVSKTKNRRPLQLIYYEYCETYSDALKREKFLKSGVGRQFLKDYLDR